MYEYIFIGQYSRGTSGWFFLCQESPIVTKWNIGKSPNINSRLVGVRDGGGEGGWLV
jgi:hypothetical protein